VPQIRLLILGTRLSKHLNISLHISSSSPLSNLHIHTHSTYYSTYSLNIHTPHQMGEWDWDNYSIVVLSQRKDLPCSALTGVKFNVWCAVGNTIHVVHSHLLRMEVGNKCHFTWH